MYYNYFRDYDPALGRYVQSDPIGLGGGMNTYGYAYQNPLKFSDPNGLVPLVVIPLIPVAEALLATATGGVLLCGITGCMDPVIDSSNDLIKEGNPADDRADSDKARQQEYLRAKNFCDQGPQPGENECASLSNEIDHAEQCVEFYEMWDARWLPGRHAEKIQGWKNRIANAKAEHNRKCVQKCDIF